MGSCNSSEAKYPEEQISSQRGSIETDLEPLHASSVLNICRSLYCRNILTMCRLKDDEVLTCSDDMVFADL